MATILLVLLDERLWRSDWPEEPAVVGWWWGKVFIQKTKITIEDISSFVPVGK